MANINDAYEAAQNALNVLDNYGASRSLPEAEFMAWKLARQKLLSAMSFIADISAMTAVANPTD